MTGRVEGNVAAGAFRPQPLTLAETTLASDLAGAALVSDSELVMRTRQGDCRSFETLYLRHLDAAWRVACTSAASTADAEDAVAEGFTKVFAALPRMVDRDIAFRPYLLACVRNAAVDRHRRTRKLDLRDEVPEYAAAAGDPDEVVLADLERNLVGEALQSLPERWRTILWLTEVEGMTPMEVSAVMGIRPSAVASLAYRAREGLRQAYLQAHVRVEAKAACRYTVERLGPYVHNKLAGRERDKVQAHLDGCATCRQRRDELVDVNASLLGALTPIPLLLASTMQQDWLSVTRPGKGTRKVMPPAKAAKAAQQGTSPTVQRTRTLVIALLLAVSGGVAAQSSGPGGRVGRTLDRVALPKHSSPATPPADGSTAAKEAFPPPVPTPTAMPPSGRATPAAVRRDAPVVEPRHQLVEARSPEPQPAPTVTSPPEQAPPPPPPSPPPAFAAVKISVGEGDSGAVIALSIPSEPAKNPRPDVDVTVGRMPLLGDAPPTDGTGVDTSLAPTTALSSLNGLLSR